MIGFSFNPVKVLALQALIALALSPPLPVKDAFLTSYLNANSYLIWPAPVKENFHKLIP
jgi:hypothetical protein